MSDDRERLKAEMLCHLTPGPLQYANPEAALEELVSIAMRERDAGQANAVRNFSQTFSAQSRAQRRIGWNEGASATANAHPSHWPLTNPYDDPEVIPHER